VDPLSDVLSLLKPRSYSSGGFDAGGKWSIQFPRHAGIKCYAVVSGKCWLSVEGVREAVRLRVGDCFLLPSGQPFRLRVMSRSPRQYRGHGHALLGEHVAQVLAAPSAAAL